MFLTECSRDAMQGWGEFIPTSKKIDYINSLMAVGFDVLDCGSFVSPKSIPQMADSGQVIDEIDKGISTTKLSVIVANLRGAEKALKHDQVDILGFPFSISETFQHRNTNKSQEEAFSEIQKISEVLASDGRLLNVYFSMAFGNPYGEMWKWEDVDFWAKRFSEIGIKNVLLSDTTGTGTLEQIESELDPEDFFRVSRKYIIPLKAIKDIVVYSNSRLKIVLPTFKMDEIIVSRERVNDFKEWLG